MLDPSSFGRAISDDSSSSMTRSVTISAVTPPPSAEEVEASLREEVLLQDKIEELKISVNRLERVVGAIENRDGTRLSDITDRELTKIIQEFFPSDESSNHKTNHDRSTTAPLSTGFPGISISQIVSGLLPSSKLPSPKIASNSARAGVNTSTSSVKNTPAVQVLDVSDPLPYLQRFTSLSLSSALSVKILNHSSSPSSPSTTVIHSHALICHAPHFLFSAVIRVEIAAHDCSIHRVIVEYLPGWVKSEIGTAADCFAKDNDIEALFSLINSYWAMLVHRAYCWISIADSLEEEVISTKSYVRDGGSNDGITTMLTTNGILLPDAQHRPVPLYDGSFTSDSAYLGFMVVAFDRSGMREWLTTYQMTIRHPLDLRIRRRMQELDDDDGLYYEISWLPMVKDLRVVPNIVFTSTSPTLKENLKLDEAHAKFITHLKRTLELLDRNLPDTLNAIYMS